MKKTTPIVSIVIPLYNEAAGVGALLTRLSAVARKLPKTEFIFVDDGSTDNTVKAIRSFKSRRIATTIITFSRNFGHQAALLAGISHSRGQYVVTMDGDLQHPPELIPAMLAAHEEGADIVFTRRIDTAEVPLTKRLTSAVFYWLMNFFADTTIAPNGSDFRSMRRSAVKALESLPEKRLFLRGMVQWIGFSSTTIPFTVGKRTVGSSKYSLAKMLKLALFGVTSFSSSLLYFSACASLILFILTLVYGAYVLYIAMVLDIAVSGWASMLLVVLGLGALLSLSLSIIGVYLAAMYEEIKRRPPYIISQIHESSSHAKK